MKYAHVSNGTVVNVVEWDGETSFSVDGELVSLDGAVASIGWTYDGEAFVAPLLEEEL